MRALIAFVVLAFAAALPIGSACARPAKAVDFVDLRSGPGENFASVLTVPAHALVEVGACRAWCRVTYARSRGYVPASAVTPIDSRPVEAPMLPPLGAYVWQRDVPPLYDPYDSAGPWYTGPWTHEGAPAVQWRYGFPGGVVDWYRGLGWRPGFGWF